MAGPIRMLLVGEPGSAFRRAAEMARDAGAEVAMADSSADAMAQLRERGGDLAMVEVSLDIAGFIAALRAERFTLPVLACGIEASAERAVAAIRAGAKDYVPLPPHRDLIAAAIATAAHHETGWVGASPILTRASALAEAVAPSGAAVLITGETGTGKETIARRIHQASGRTGPIVVAECAGVPVELLESELFGHEAGAFPAATARRIGRIEKAASGTIVLREVGALPPAIQARLAAVLADRRFTRVGGGDGIAFEARLVATTGMDLETCVAEGRFRADLLARLCLVRVGLPPLRERGNDIAVLARHFADRLAESDGIAVYPFSEAALAALAQHSWPGNIRELEDTVHRALLLAHGPEIMPEDLIRADGQPLFLPGAEAGERGSLVGRTVEDVERELILRTLESCHGNRTSASNILGISVRTMRNKLRAYIEAGIPVSPA